MLMEVSVQKASHERSEGKMSIQREVDYIGWVRGRAHDSTGACASVARGVGGRRSAMLNSLAVARRMQPL